MAKISQNSSAARFFIFLIYADSTVRYSGNARSRGALFCIFCRYEKLLDVAYDLALIAVFRVKLKRQGILCGISHNEKRRRVI